MKTVLVTGSNGFIGRHVCRYFREQGFQVIGLGRRDAPVFCDVDDYIQCELPDGPAAAELSGFAFDAIVHLASDMRRNPFERDILRHNCEGTERLLELCRDLQIGTFVQLSSLPVIGCPKTHPITENHPIDPPTFYHLTKYTQELMAEYAFKNQWVRSISLRICAPVGIGMKSNTIFPTFVRRAVDGEDLILYGKGGRMQTYIHVEDIARGILCALNSEKVHGVYNLGSENLLSNAELAEKCVKVLGSSSAIRQNGQEDPEEGNKWDICFDKLKQDAGYEPQVSIEYAIREYAASLGETE